MKQNLAQLGADLSSAANHSSTSTIVCLKDVHGKNLNGESWSEHNLSLSSSNYANTITNTWP